jgi:hypothetical protein
MLAIHQYDASCGFGADQQRCIGPAKNKPDRSCWRLLSFYHSGLVVCVFGSQNILYVAAKNDAMLEEFSATFDLNLDYL